MFKHTFWKSLKYAGALQQELCLSISSWEKTMLIVLVSHLHPYVWLAVFSALFQNHLSYVILCFQACNLLG